MITIFHVLAFIGAVVGLVNGIAFGSMLYGWPGGIVGAVLGAYIGLVLGRLPRLVAIWRLKSSSKNTQPKNGENKSTPR